MLSGAWFDALRPGDLVIMSRHLQPDHIGIVEKRSAKYVTVRGLRFRGDGYAVGAGYSLTRIEEPRPGQVERIRAVSELTAALQRLPRPSAWGPERVDAAITTEAISEAAALLRQVAVLLAKP